MKTQQFIKLSLYSALMLGSIASLRAYDRWEDSPEPRKRLVRLDRSWKFAVGDEPERAARTYDDSGWATIHSSETWQDEGYRDYNGYAWYRQSFSVPIDYEQESVFLSLGNIDD